MKPDRIKIKKFLLACTLNLLLVLSAIYQSDLFDKFMLQIIESELYERESKSKNDTRMSTVSLNQLRDILPSSKVCSIITRAWQLQSATGFILHAMWNATQMNRQQNGAQQDFKSFPLLQYSYPPYWHWNFTSIIVQTTDLLIKKGIIKDFQITNAL